MPRTALASAEPPEDPDPVTFTTTTTATTLSASPYVGQIVHYMGHGSAECMAAIIKRIVPTTPGLPEVDRAELAIFSPITPHPLCLTAEHDEARGYTTWHWIHP